jgi:hypothetical protein
MPQITEEFGEDDDEVSAITSEKPPDEQRTTLEERPRGKTSRCLDGAYFRGATFR